LVLCCLRAGVGVVRLAFFTNMKLTSLHIHQQVRHPQYGVGEIKAMNEHTVDVQFADGRRTVAPETSGLEPADAQAVLTGMAKPLEQLIRETVQEVVGALGLERGDEEVRQLGTKWNGGKLVLRPADPTLQAKDLPVETFFHKIVGIRNQLRVLEQKLNAHEGLNDGEKVEFQQYISRCYGSLTSFNVLFRDKEDQFSSK
jgi:hypothetical protein